MSDTNIKPGVDFEIWNNDDRGGASDSFSNTQYQDNIVGNTDSLQIVANIWVIVFNETNFKGNMMQIDPGTGGNYLSDLNHVNRYPSSIIYPSGSSGNNVVISGSKQGDWKSQIQSFILYKTKPSWWGKTPSSDDLFYPGDNNALFTENTNFLGDNRTFAAPYNAVNLGSVGYTTNSGQMYSTVTGGNINSLRNGKNVWLTIYDDLDCNGCAKLISPDHNYSDLNNQNRYDLKGNLKGDWKNQIASFLLFPSKPAFWDTNYPRPYLDFVKLFATYPGTTNSNTDDKIVYVIEDATYQIYEPEVKIQTTTQSLDNYYINDDFTKLPLDGWTKYHVKLEHKNKAGRNDKAEMDLYFDNKGKLVSIQHFQWSSDGAYQIPQQLITIVDDEAWVLGTAGAIETLGISEEAADTFIEIFDFVCKVFNDVTALVYKMTDDGGRYYFLPVICHTINRICTTIWTTFNTPTYISPTDIRANKAFSFNYNGYNAALANTEFHFSKLNNWAQKSGSVGTLPFNQVIELTYQNYNYRTWYQEVSFSEALGMIVSCKIDYEIDDHKDDHIILMVGFRVPEETQSTPVLNFAQATIQFTDQSNDNIMTTPCTGNDIVGNLINQLSTALSKVTPNSSRGGRAYLADMAKANVEAIIACAQFLPSSNH
jgi:hypothetical protein